MKLDSYELYLARQHASNVRYFYESGKLTLEEAQQLAREHIWNHGGTLDLFIRAGIFTLESVKADSELAPLIPALYMSSDNQ